MSMFLLASAKKDLSMCSFRLFSVQKPKEEEAWSTKVTDEDLENAVEDEFGVKYSKDWKRLLKAPVLFEGKYSIRDGVKVIGDKAFMGCGFLFNIDLPDSVKSIGRCAFWGCDQLGSIIIPDGVTSIGNSAFSYCGFLRSINIPNSVTTIEDGALCGCENLPSHIKSDIIQRFGEKVFK